MIAFVISGIFTENLVQKVMVSRTQGKEDSRIITGHIKVELDCQTRMFIIYPTESSSCIPPCSCFVCAQFNPTILSYSGADPELDLGGGGDMALFCCLFHVRSFLMQLNAIGNTTVWEGM